MKKLVIPCSLFIVTMLSLILTISLILIVTSPYYPIINFSLTSVLLGMLCSVSIFYISIFMNISLMMKPKYKEQFRTDSYNEKNTFL